MCCMLMTVKQIFLNIQKEALIDSISKRYKNSILSTTVKLRLSALLKQVPPLFAYFFQSYDPASEEFDVPPNKARSELAYAKVSIL